MSGIIVAVATVSGVGLVAAIILVIASKVMEVKVDERIEEVREELPGANCGACGFAGCDDFAKAVVEQGADPSLCIPGGATTAAKVAEIMGTSAGDVQKKVAVLKCQGSTKCTTKKYEYAGVNSCKAVNQMFGGDGSCAYGCLGYGDCVLVCKFGAMEVVDGIVRIDEDKCTSCGACVKECPKGLLQIVPSKTTAFVQCNNEQKGAQTRKVCTVGCIACTKCVRSCPSEAIHMENNRAIIDPEKCTYCGICVKECPTHAINMM